MGDRNAESAKKLLTGSQVFATNSRDGFAAQYETLGRIPITEWNFSLAIAGVGTALLVMSARYSSEEQKELTAAVIATLNESDESAVHNLQNFIHFVTTGTKDSAAVPELIGNWVLRHHHLAEAEHSAPHVIGMMLLNTFGTWWDQ